MGNPIERVIRVLDRWQQRSRAAGFVFGVVKKFGDDRGGALAAMVTYYGFLALFPLLLVAFTVLGYVAGQPDSSLYVKIQHSVLSEFPVVGSQLQTNDGLHRSGLGLVIGVAGLLWGSMGVTQAVQFATNEAWDVPNRLRPGFFPRLGKGVLFFAFLGIGVALTAALTSLGAVVHGSQLAGAVGLLASLAANLLIFSAVFKLLSPKHLGWRDLLPGVVVAAVGWQALQFVGQSLVRHQLRNTSAIYGQFAVVLGLISFISLAAQLVTYAVEVNVVRYKRLWPRSIIQPPLLEADKRVLAMRATQEERRPEQEVTVTWHEPEPPAVEPEPAGP